MQEVNDPLNMVYVTAVHSGMEAQSTRHRVKKMIKSNNQFSNNDYLSTVLRCDNLRSKMRHFYLSLSGWPLKFKHSSRIVSHAATVDSRQRSASQSCCMCVLRMRLNEREGVARRERWKMREGLIIPEKGFYKPQDSHYRSLCFRFG